MPPGRDLIGHALARPVVRWPGDAQLAVSLVVNYEEGAEACVGDGDARNDRAAELGSGVPETRRDLALEQMFAYGTRCGLDRILDGLAEHRLRATFMFCGRAAARTPALARRAVDAGHEAACHGWAWANHALMDDRDAERREIERAVRDIEAATGQRPLGFYSRWGPSVHTRALLRELGFVYDSNAYDDDLPYWDRTLPGGPMLVLPYALDSNDYKFFEGDPWGTGEAFVAYLRAAIDELLDEGARGAPKMLSIGLHLRIVGRPGRFRALRRLFADLASLGPRVWVAPRIEIARHWMAQHPTLP
jgi:peptidoglycan/xylan/chitin deacetylase (PgdA/CDA1 family)